MHECNHYWECTDIPGYFICNICFSVSRYNRETEEKEILMEMEKK